jgi:predicted HD phosphohydrolase
VSQSVAPARSVDAVLEVYERWGGERYNDQVRQLAHALQTAAHATAAGASEQLVAAALLHDVGTVLMLGLGVRGRYEQTGPAFLAELFPPAVTEPITLHVAAKRYLCAVDPDYTAVLSASSVRSLVRQGGPMAADEIAALEASPAWSDAVALRRWDDAAKVEGAVVPGLATYEPLLRAVTTV